MTPATLSAFTYELEKIAISGEFAGRALANRVTTLKNMSNIPAAARLAQRTAEQGMGIGSEFIRRADQARTGVLNTRGGAGAIAKAGDKLDLAQAHQNAFANAQRTVGQNSAVVDAYARAPEVAEGMRQFKTSYTSPLLRRR